MIDEKVDKYTHLSSPPCSETNIEQIQSVRQLLQEKYGKLFESYESWLTNEQILRFLIARNFDAGEKSILIFSYYNFYVIVNFKTPIFIRCMHKSFGNCIKVERNTQA